MLVVAACSTPSLNHLYPVMVASAVAAQVKVTSSPWLGEATLEVITGVPGLAVEGIGYSFINYLFL